MQRQVIANPGCDERDTGAPLVQRVYRAIEVFLDLPRLPFQPVRSKRLDAAGLVENTGALSLFAYMTAHPRAEIRAQDALFPFLRSRFAVVEREWPWRHATGLRLFDFLVEDSGQRLILELKHLSPHQSGRHAAPQRLLNLLGPVVAPGGRSIPTLYDDFVKPRPSDLALIQLGLFTGVDGWTEGAARADIDHYFIRRYVARALPANDYRDGSAAALDNWAHRACFRCPDQIAGAHAYREGRLTSMVTPSGIDVRGRVNFFMGVAVAPCGGALA